MKTPILLLLCLAFASITQAQFDPNNALKLTATGLTSSDALLGFSSAISSDGATVIAGAPYENSHIGAAVVFRKSAGGCYYQEAILTPKVNSGKSLFGWSVAISSDGNTAAVGGDSDQQGLGNVWIFTRSNGKWTEQAKLQGSDYTGKALQGYAVGLSGDGKTLVFGGPYDNYNSSTGSAVGASWYFKFANNAWKQISSKITSSASYFKSPYQGYSVAVSTDGKTAIVGAPTALDKAQSFWGTGGITLYTLSSDWNESTNIEGANNQYWKYALGGAVAINNDGTTSIIGAPGANNLEGTAYVFDAKASTVTELQTSTSPGTPQKGNAVAVSDDGTIAVIGDVAPNSPGAVWVLKSSGGVWQQQGNKGLIGPNGKGNSQQGCSVGISKDGTTFVSGGASDDNSAGAVWLFPNKAMVITNPIVSSFSPTSAAAGTKVTITGTNLMAVNHVYFGGVEASSINHIDDHSLEAWVAAGSITGDVKVSTLCGDATKSGFTYKGTSGISYSDENSVSATIYPNPASDYMMVDFTSEIKEPLLLTITDHIGRVIHTETVQAGRSTFQLPVSTLAKGFYILRLQTISKGISTYSFIKN